MRSVVARRKANGALPTKQTPQHKVLIVRLVVGNADSWVRIEQATDRKLVREDFIHVGSNIMRGAPFQHILLRARWCARDEFIDGWNFNWLIRSEQVVAAI